MKTISIGRCIWLGYTCVCVVEWFYSTTYCLQEEQGKSDGAATEKWSLITGRDWGMNDVYGHGLQFASLPMSASIYQEDQEDWRSL